MTMTTTMSPMLATTLRTHAHVDTHIEVDIQSRRRLLIHLERVDIPERVRKSAGVISDKAGAASLRSALAGAPNAAGPVAAEGNIEDLGANNSQRWTEQSKTKA
jgi:hypothetical protein